MPFRPGKEIKTKQVALQNLWVKQLFPQFHFRWVKGRACWTGFLKPSSESPDYKVQIEYRLLYHPKTHILHPEILPDAPHVYKSDKSLCLYYPIDGSWSSDLLIAKTIIPWTAEWLRFYEIWCVTGKWFGPEAPHVGTK